MANLLLGTSLLNKRAILGPRIPSLRKGISLPPWGNEKASIGPPSMIYPHTIDTQLGMQCEVALDMLLERPIAGIGYPASAYACKTLGGPFVAGIGGKPMSCASRAALKIS